jgi:hypothetical protein
MVILSESKTSLTPKPSSKVGEGSRKSLKWFSITIGLEPTYYK